MSKPIPHCLKTERRNTMGERILFCVVGFICIVAVVGLIRTICKGLNMTKQTEELYGFITGVFMFMFFRHLWDFLPPM